MDVSEEAIAKRNKLLDIGRKRMNKSRTTLGNDPKLVMPTISTEIPQLDSILGGGWRMGRIAMVVGEASMGKTLITQWSIAAFQRQGMVCGFIDPEKTFDPHWFEVTGVNTEQLIVARPESTEQAFDLAVDWATNGMDLVVLDSLAALTPKMRAENELEKQEVIGLSARKIGEGLNVLNNKNERAMILFTNQLRSKVGQVYGSPDEIPGGRAQKFFASYGLKVRRKGWIKEKDTRIGYTLGVDTFKNKVTTPLQECQIPFLFSGVIDTVAGLVNTAMELELIPGSRGFYQWNGQKIHGMAKLKQFFIDNPDEQEQLRALVEHGAIPDFGEEVPVEDGD